MAASSKLTFLVAVLATALVGSPALACSCLDLPVEELAKQADAVFVGKVVALEVSESPRLNPGEAGDEVIATVRVTEQLKGASAEVVRMRNTTGCCYCEFAFAIAQEYLVFSVKSGEYFRTSICSGTKLLAEAQADLERLRQAAGVNGQERP